MDVITTHIDPEDETFQINRKTMLRRLDEHEELCAEVRNGGSQRAVERHRAAGRLLVRERIEMLVDPHEYFLELSPLAAWDSDYANGASLVTGVAVVSGVE